ncbi:MAG: hypothetical protein RJB13_2367, partial [Pseudomonadota bacterium]
MFWLRYLILSVCAAIGVMVQTSCIKNSNSPADQEKNNGVAKQSDALVQNQGLELLSPLGQRTSTAARIPDASLVDTYFALSVCDCLPQLQAALITSVNETRGALPQALTPAIRREILSNPKLKILEIIPRPVDNIIGGIFADEMTVAKEVSEGLEKKVKAADSTWNTPNEVFRFHLDSFPPLPGTAAPLAERWVHMPDVFARWALVLSQGGPWSSIVKTHPMRGLLWNETLRILAEGEYLYGLNEDGKGGQWGGLTVPIDLQINTPGAFDPRKGSNQIRFLTGVLDLTLPNNNSLSLARYGEERWSWRMNRVSLAEQALHWWTAARLLERMRPATRGDYARYFLADSVIPSDAYQLALLVLPGLDALLSERFIDENTRLIQEEVSGPQVAGVAQTLNQKASPQTLSLLLLALTEWGSQLKNITDLDVSNETRAQLSGAPKSLTRAAQLIVQTLLSENIREKKSTESEKTIIPIYGVFLDKNVNTEVSLKDHGMILSALIAAETKLMPSAFLRQRIQQLSAGFLSRIEAEQATQQAPKS